MPSIDPHSINTVEAAGIHFQIHELKIAGRRDITNTLKTFGKADDVESIFDVLVACVLRYVIGWSLDKPLNQETLESSTDVMDLIALLRVMVLSGMLSAEDKKKSESQPTSNAKSSVLVVSEANVAMTETETLQSNAQFATGPDVAIVTTAILPLVAQESFAVHSPTKSI